MNRNFRWVVAPAVMAACASARPATAPAPAARAASGGGISLRDDWRATAIVERSDSIVLTLPSGDRQLQRYLRRAVFTLNVAQNGHVTIRLDSLADTPSANSANSAMIGSTWSGQLNDARVDALRVDHGGDAADELTVLVRDLLPTLPADGALPHRTWTDSGAGQVRVDIFSATERHTDDWSASAASEHSSNGAIAVHDQETFEQLGDGSQGGHKLTMTSQGRRIATYYLTSDGTLSSAMVDDSVAMLISIPATRQVIPTLRFARTSVRYLMARGRPD